MDIFKNPTSRVPKSDPQIVRVDMEQMDVGGRKAHLPKEGKSPDLSIVHVPGSK